MPGSEIDEAKLPPFNGGNINPNIVASLLLSLARELDKRGAELDALEEDYVKAAEIHNVAHTKAFLVARSQEKPQYECTAIADDATADERLTMLIAESKIKAHKRSIEIIKERIKVGQTASATLRQELDLGRTYHRT